MYDNTLDYFAKKSQTTINKYILKVNSHRKKLREGEKFTLSKVSDIKNTHLYPNKPKTIKTIREGSTKEILSHLTTTVATSIQQNLELETHKKPLYENVSEVFWGNVNSVLNSVAQSSLFIFHLFADLKDHPEFKDKIDYALRIYSPYAYYSAMEFLSSKRVIEPILIDHSFKQEHIYIWGEAIYHFTLFSSVAEEIIKKFFDFLSSEYYFETRDSNGRYKRKSEVITFQNFEKAISNHIRDILEPLLKIDISGTFGHHIYNLTINSYIIYNELISAEMTTPPEYLQLHYSASGEEYYSVRKELMDKTDSYISDLFDIEDRLNGKPIDFKKTAIFRTNKKHLFSEVLFEQLVEEEEERKIKEYIDQQKIAEEQSIEAARKTYLHRKMS